MATTAEAPPPETTELVRAYRPHRLTIDRYDRMITAGVFTEKDPVFLWKGQLVEKMTKNPPHTIAVTELHRVMLRLVPEGWYVAQEQPMAIADDGVPEPDLTVVRGRTRDYKERSPTAQDVALVVEVADSSVAIDSGEVLQTYAREAIPVYWIVNLPKGRIEVYTEPSGPADVSSYGSQRHYGPDDEVPVVLDGREVARIAVRDVLP
jgi:Uma2 family endonuclease